MLNPSIKIIATAILSLFLGYWILRLSPVVLESYHWHLIKFKMRYFPLMRKEVCYSMRRLAAFGSEVNMDIQFLKKDYPNLLEKDQPTETNVPKGDRSWNQYSQYKLREINLIPNDYLIVYIFETQILPYTKSKDYVWTIGDTFFHTAVYKKNTAGEYSRIEHCRILKL